MQIQTCNVASRTLLVCVDSYNEGVPRGCFYDYGQRGEDHEFQSLAQLIVGVENILCSAQPSDSFTTERSFSVMWEPVSKTWESTRIRRGERATFMVEILFYQHNSWQGAITWLEKESKQTFRSVLELVLLLDNALNDAEEELSPCL